MPTVVPFLTISDLFVNLARKYENSGKTAFARKPTPSSEYEPISWLKFTSDTRALAAFMMDAGVQKGDRIAILSENRYEWAVTDMAIQLLGAVNVALYATLPSNQCEYILNDSESTHFFVSTGIQLKKALDVFADCGTVKQVIAYDRPKVEKHLENDFVVLFDEILEKGKELCPKYEKAINQSAKTVSPEDLSTLIYTSGTTGQPKGAMLTHNNLVSNVKAAHQCIDLGENDKTLSFLPLCHSFERTAGYYAMLAGGAEIYFAESVDTVAKNLTEARPTVVTSVPRLFERIFNLVNKSIQEGSDAKKQIFKWALGVGEKYVAGKRGLVSLQYRLADQLVFSKLKERTGGNLRFFVSGGAALPPDIGNFFMYSGINIIEGYGLTETSPVISVNPYGAERIGTVGHVMPGITVGIQRLEDGKIIAEVSGESYPNTVSSDEGEIIVRGPNIMKGYWKKDEATKEVIDADGWFHTGDIGKFDDGYLKITDRLKHMIVNAGGKNIYPGPIEDMVKTSLYVDQVVIIGERRTFMSALIVPDFESLAKFANDNDLGISKPEELVAHEEIKKIYQKELREFSKKLASHEKIRDFRLLTDEFTIETGELTPTLKVKRRVIEKKYADLIEEIYASDKA